MSSLGSWAYVNYLYHKKATGFNHNTGEYEYAEAVEFMGYYKENVEAITDSQGVEFIPQFSIISDADLGIEVGDLVALCGLFEDSKTPESEADFKMVRRNILFNSTAINETDMDYEVYT